MIQAEYYKKNKEKKRKIFIMINGKTIAEININTEKGKNEKKESKTY